MKQELSDKIISALKAGPFKDAEDAVIVDYPPTGVDEIHVVVVSRKFEGLRMKQKISLITSALRGKLSKREHTRITLVMGLTPDDVKAVA